jgi:hypothetical protein
MNYLRSWGPWRLCRDHIIVIIFHIIIINETSPCHRTWSTASLCCHSSAPPLWTRCWSLPILCAYYRLLLPPKFRRHSMKWDIKSSRYKDHSTMQVFWHCSACSITTKNPNFLFHCTVSSCSQKPKPVTGCPLLKWSLIVKNTQKEDCFMS